MANETVYNIKAEVIVVTTPYTLAMWFQSAMVQNHSSSSGDALVEFFSYNKGTGAQNSMGVAWLEKGRDLILQCRDTMGWNQIIVTKNDPSDKVQIIVNR